MQYYDIEKQEHGFHVNGFPDAVKLLRLDGPKPKRLADLALHKHDLDFSLSCVDAINSIPDEQLTVRLALWRTSIVHYYKCFSDSAARFSLDPKPIYSGKGYALENFEFFRALRNKTIVHDENSYTQALPGAVLNPEHSQRKIAKIMCGSFHGEVLDQDSFSNFRLLVTHAIEYVAEQFDELCEVITNELEKQPYSDLLVMDHVVYEKPKEGDESRSRNAL